MVPHLMLAVALALRPIAGDTASCAAAAPLPPASAASPGFLPGEAFDYAVSFGRVHVGSGEMRLVGRDTLRGRQVWKARFLISGGFLKLSVHDTSMSWFDSLSFDSFRFIENIHDPTYHANRDTRIFPDSGIYKRANDPDRPTVADPLDDISLVYYVRSLQLEPGRCYELRRYYRADGNPIVIRVLRRDTVTVPAGRFPALVVQPEISGSSLFAKRGRAELWLSDDRARMVLQLKSQLPFGSINLYLRPLRPRDAPRVP